jgi:hypothetical protein
MAKRFSKPGCDPSKVARWGRSNTMMRPRMRRRWLPGSRRWEGKPSLTSAATACQAQSRPVPNADVRTHNPAPLSNACRSAGHGHGKADGRPHEVRSARASRIPGAYPHVRTALPPGQAPDRRRPLGSKEETTRLSHYRRRASAGFKRRADRLSPDCFALIRFFRHLARCFAALCRTPQRNGLGR